MLSEKVTELLGRLTLQEKAALCSGRDFWYLRGVDHLELPAIMVTDGPHGLRKQEGAADHVGLNDSVPATCFPTASGLASTWNRELVRQVGVALGRECRQERVSVLLGPGINIKRNPLGGRNFEYFSEDPFLTGEMAVAWVDGVQAQGVGTSLKHFAVNNHETGRMVVDVIVDERTLREIYLPAFEKAVQQAQPWTVMCAYNKVNGTYLAEHRQLLTMILRDEWGFDGLVLSDWGAVNDRVAGVAAGLDLEMPSSGEVNTRLILAAVEDGTLASSELDLAVERVLALILKCAPSLQESPRCSLADHHDLARAVAEEACVLLKNEGNLLPLKRPAKLAVIGELATQTRYQGSGSSQINPTCLEQPLEQIELLAGEGSTVSYARGYALSGDGDVSMIEEALDLARESDVVVVIVGLTPEYESEGFDRCHMCLPQAQLDLVSALATELGEKVVLALQNGAPVEMPFMDHVACILECYLGGQAGASALANVLFGRVNPSGKLAETFPLNQADVPSSNWFPGSLRQSQYREGIWVGYRYFDTLRVPVAFPFGHGLSYTHFDYTDLRIRGREHEAGYRMEARDTLSVEFRIKNSGTRDGAEVAQVYVGQCQPTVHRPARELRQFAKVRITAGASATVSLLLDARAFARWSVSAGAWIVDSGDYNIYVGASVADIRLQGRISLVAAEPGTAPDPALERYQNPRNLVFDDEAFTALLGGQIPAAVAEKPFHLNSTLSEVRGTWLGRKLRAIIESQIAKTMGADLGESQRRMLDAVVAQMPLRNLVTQSQGKLSPALMRSIVHIMNGDWWKLLRAAPIDAR